jgi:phosphoribosylformylglycinamidine synthase
MKRSKVCVLKSAGTNCDKETAFAFSIAGAEARLVHVNELIGARDFLDNYHILALPGGFSYGDDIAAGKILANELKCKLGSQLRAFLDDGKLIIGICNGFQVLVKCGLLPGNDSLAQEASLVINDSAKFEDRWVYLKSQKSKVKSQKCVWTNGLPEIIYLPVAHGEGKFITRDKGVLEGLKKNNQIAFWYCDEAGRFTGYPDNPNGSSGNIAGICDKTGRVLGLMPHPERHIYRQQHPRWQSRSQKAAGDGLRIFQNGLDYVRKEL